MDEGTHLQGTRRGAGFIKPDARIAAPSHDDVDQEERVTRAMQDSGLHLCASNLAMGLPPELKEGEYAHLGPGAVQLHLDCTFVTDGVRGWMVLVAADDDYDVEAEVSECFEGLLPGHQASGQLVVRATYRWRRPPYRALCIGLPCETRLRIEAEYTRRLFRGPPTDHQALLSACRGMGYTVRDERAMRETFAKYDTW
jgi:hypothetical protein